MEVTTVRVTGASTCDQCDLITCDDSTTSALKLELGHFVLYSGLRKKLGSTKFGKDLNIMAKEV